MATLLEKALSDFEKSEKFAEVYVHSQDLYDPSGPGIELHYVPKSQITFKGHRISITPKALIISIPEIVDDTLYTSDEKIDFTDNYSISRIYNMDDERQRETINPESVKKDNYIFWTYLEKGLGLDPRYIISNYKEQTKNMGEGVYRTELIRTSGSSLFSEIFLSEQNRIERIRLYPINGEKFKDFGKNKYDFYLEAMPLRPDPESRFIKLYLEDEKEWVVWDMKHK